MLVDVGRHHADWALFGSGYIEAGHHIVLAMLKEDGAPIHTVKIHPALQCYRMGIEIYYKAIVFDLGQLLGETAESLTSKLKGKRHNLAALDCLMRAYIKRAIDQYPEVEGTPHMLSQKTTETVNWFIEIDPTAQVTRYPVAIEGKLLNSAGEKKFSIELIKLAKNMNDLAEDFYNTYVQFGYLWHRQKTEEGMEAQIRRYYEGQ